MKIIFFGTSSVAIPILNALHEYHEVLAVVTAPDMPVGRRQTITPSPVSVTAEEYDIPTLKPAKVKNNLEFFEQLQQLTADIFIVVSYGKILPLQVIDLPRLKTLNIHFSELPKYRGAAPIQWSLMNGETTTATTIFILDELMDHGPILAQEQTAISSNDTFETLSDRMAEQSAKLLVNILPKYESGNIDPRTQDHGLATATGMISKSSGQIDWHDSAQTIYNLFRAFHKWPGIWTTWEKKMFKILSCIPYEKPIINSILEKLSVREITQIKSENSNENIVLVKCGDSTWLQLITVQLEGQKATEVNAFMRGHNNFHNVG